MNQEEKLWRLEYCKGLVELLCRDDPRALEEIVRAALRGVESSQGQEAEVVEHTT
jgi:hypothetical protein